MMKSKWLWMMGAVLSLASCKTNENETLWISGYQVTPQEENVSPYLTFHKGGDLNGETWSKLNQPIDGFTFEEGVMKKIEVKMNEDSSYNFIKDLEAKDDPRLELNGAWILETLNGKSLDSVFIPYLNVDIQKQLITGNGGCNSFSAPIQKLGTKSIVLGNAAATLKACVEPNIEGDFYKALIEINSFSLDGDVLKLTDESGATILTFKRNKMAGLMQNLNGTWKLKEMNGNIVDSNIVIPTLNFDLMKGRVYGVDGCNNYFGPVDSISSTELIFGSLASTKKACEDMVTADAYSSALGEVTSYTVKGQELTLLNNNQEVILLFIK